jgi:mannose-6-phosphate isomerase-like protein (cupin superfamily)
MDRGSNSEYIIAMDRLESFYDEPGEYGWIMEGYKHGFNLTSVIITQTAPLGGPPLHNHHTEEIHVLPECRLAYMMGERTFEIEGPCMVNIPPNIPHTFLNLGPEPVRIVCFWPANDFWNNYEELGPNPLLEKYGITAKAG